MREEVQVTGYTVHTGSTDDFSKGWDQIFGEKTVKKEKKRNPRNKQALRKIRKEKKS